MRLGIIVVWSGAIADIPLGWALCDGTKGTPDLRDVFVIGSGGSFDPDDQGSDEDHVHDFTGSGHTHAFSAGSDINQGNDFSTTVDSAAVTGTTEIGSGFPAYYSLAYIQKILGV